MRRSQLLLLFLLVPLLIHSSQACELPMDFFNNGERPCRACTSLEEMMGWSKKMLGLKQGGSGGGGDDATNKSGSTSMAEAAPVERRKDCPVDKDELGRSTWNLLHTMSVTYPEKPSAEQKEDMSTFLTVLSKSYPCDYCAKDFRKELKQHPPRLESRKELATWMCEAHNRVNEKLGKEKFDCTKTFERWKDGWRDGSCGF